MISIDYFWSVFYFVGHYESENGQGASDVAEEVDVLAEEKESRHHSDGGLEIKIIVGSYGPDRFHGFVPKQIRHHGAHHRQEKEIEEEFGMREVKDDIKMQRLRLNEHQGDSSHDSVEKQFSGDEETAV